ncbi:MAG TPA: dihydrodipicolinate synthase family protein [Verrucomicrobiae bacterium]|jgi:4-hydroxy-tetrahydrodipicolinate synthase|nr:dihydrodipicolinate synthase family protein [Verrucomicrobiae bacterium]
MEPLSGVFCALWIPTDSRGEVIWSALEKHLEWLLASGVHGVMALGSTGEFPHLSLAQRKAVLEKSFQLCARRRLPVIANISDVQHRTVIELGQYARSLGATVAAVLPPWFYPVHREDLAEFFIQVARKTELPLLLYNYPEVTGKTIDLETVEQVARTVPVAAFKQSGADFEYHHPLLQLAAKLKFSLLTGADTRFAEALRLGCTGTVSGLANAVPDVLSRIYEDSRRGVASVKQTEFVAQLAREIAPLPFPLNVKATITARGFETGEAKNPVSKKTQLAYEAAVERIRELFTTGIP